MRSFVVYGVVSKQGVIVDVIEQQTIPRQLWGYFWRYVLYMLPIAAVLIAMKDYTLVRKAYILVMALGLVGCVGVIAGCGNILADRYRRNK